MPANRQQLRRSLFRLVAGQAGHFTAAQALEIGYSYQAQKYHVDYGNWERVDRGMFRIPEWPVGLHDGLVRWVLWSKGRAVVSHDSAASAYGLGVANPAKTHLTVPPEFTKSNPHLVLYHRLLPDSDLSVLDGAAITSLERTALDIIEAHVDEEFILDIVQDAMDTGIVTRQRLKRRLEELSQPARVRGERVLEGLGEDEPA